jgi:hypothetical protein
MGLETRLRVAAVRYASVGTRFGGPRNPRTGTDGEGGSGYEDRPARLLAFDLPLQAAAVVSYQPLPSAE